MRAETLSGDDRLQAIADAPRCEHEAIDQHRVFPTEHSIPTDYICPGAPKLVALLDALTKEERYGRFDSRPLSEVQEDGSVDGGAESVLRSGAVSHEVGCPGEDEGTIPTRYELTD